LIGGRERLILKMRGRRQLGIIMIAVMILLSVPMTVGAATPPSDISVYIYNQRLVSVDKPFIDNGRTLVPMRAFFEALGARVGWDSANSVAIGTRDGNVVRIPIGSNAPTVNGSVNRIDVPARIVNGRTYIPLRFVGEALGDEVLWEGSSRSIYISRKTGGPGTGTPSGANQADIIFLHHSTGDVIWEGGVAQWFADYNQQHSTSYKITQTHFPTWESAYGWKNYPFDYYNIWVKNAGSQPFKDAPTLEMLTRQYDVIVFKHCFPVSEVTADSGDPDINSNARTLGNYKLQYEALKKKMNQFPHTRFILWTPTALVAKQSLPQDAQRADEFAKWVRTVWDTPGDNIYLWDFRSLQVEGGLYFKDSYAANPDDSHPNSGFARRVAPYFGQRVVDVIQGNGDKTSITGK